MARVFKWLGLGIGLTVVAALAIACVLLRPKYLEYQAVADGFDLGELDRIPAISEVFDQAGMSYGRLPGAVRYVVPLSEISPNFVKAVLAREDSRFYEHHGVDFDGIVRAAVRNLRAGGVREGASTITQQLARNTFDLGNDRWRRKGVEALLALRIEKNLTKGQIFEAYANRIYYGAGIYGVETASRACFGKSAKDLTLSEAAILAGLIRSPNRMSPLEDSRTALAQRDQVLARMEELKMITSPEAATARAEPMPDAKRQPPRVQENYAMDAVTRDLAILLPREVIDRGGLKIYTTIDRRLQMLAEMSVQSKLSALESARDWPHPRWAAAPAEATSHGSLAAGEKVGESPYIQGALVAIDNETGGIRAMVGGRDYKGSPYNRAILSKRQIGSTVKPFVYAAALERGLLPGTMIDDSPLRAGEVAGLTTSWTPENSDGENLGLQPAEVGLIRSRNTMTVRVGEMASRASVRQLAVNAGLEKVPDVPSIYLGAFETTLKSLTAAYTMFPNGGVRKQAYIIDHIVDRHGQTIYKASHAEMRCISPAVDEEMNAMLGEVLKKGTASESGSLGLTVPAAGKTGTTDDYKDAWFIGFTTRLTCGVWVGMDRPARIEDHGYGSKLALPIWVDFVENASAWKYDAGKFASPSDLQTVELCRLSGGVATDECRAEGTAYSAAVPKELVPHKYCAVHGGSLAGLPTDAAATPVVALAEEARPLGDPDSAAGAIPMADAIPVARAVPANSSTQGPPPAGASYRIVRKPHELIILSGP